MNASRSGFTLVEVLVAQAVLLAGFTVLGLYLAAFRRVSAAEMSRADHALAAVRYVESQIIDPPACADTVYTRRASLTSNKFSLTGDKLFLISDKHLLAGNKLSQTIDVVLTPVTPSVQYLELRSEHITFRRLVRCRKASR